VSPGLPRRRMGCRVPYRDVRVNLRRVEPRMAEHLLDEADVRAASCISVAIVWRKRWQAPVLAELRRFDA
jgi:hypothetical protein